MLGRLIRKGDKNLLRILFSAAPSADASLAEALSDTFASELRADPKGFLIQLDSQPGETRASVRKRLESGPLTSEDIEKLRTELQTLSRDKSVGRTASDILSSSLFKR
jgi:hypothetical protein